MSFNFGNTSTTGLGATSSTPAKPTTFGSFSFGQQASTPRFGAPQTVAIAPAFGGTAATAPAFGTQAAPAFGASSFGATGFGAPASTTAFSFSSNTATPAPTFAGFGTTTTSAAPAFGGFGNTAGTAAPSFGGFGSFGATATSSAPLFGGLGTTTSTTTGFSGFGSSFGAGFGQTSNQLGFGVGLGQQQQQQLQQQQPQPLTAEEAFMQSIFNVSIFGDERDTVIAKWNYLQAMLGTGKSFYSQTNPPVDITPQNYLCRFKTMSYHKLPGKENKVGLVGLIFNKSLGQVKEQQQQLVNNLNQIFGNKPNLVVNVESAKSISENKCQVVIYLEEKSQTSNETKRILATEVAGFLNQSNTKQQMEILGVDAIVPLVLPDEDQLKEYLENPPKGIDPRMWKQAKIDNPDVSKFIPVPMIGFQELKWRIKCQENETDTHLSYLAKVEKEIAELKQRHTNTTAKIMEHRRKFTELSHRILKIIVKQESTRKMGISLSPEEELIRTKLENMHALVSAPTQFKGRLSELLSQMRMQRNQWAHSGGVNEYTLDKESSEEMKSFLSMQQKAMSFLIETVNKDLKDLKVISEGMTRLIQG